ncbi:uncharacterized protein LOC123214653 isoform X2 [Mangifera indica]|uniref:uncharacterized protein LOC123214653 isoform X2 n=1 Tax=Mangifera indica TaxID=29780 RepID=UPI001CFA1805|nr:uncharacterized protein LOC123214653 isoform X2 [Mangifera indica]
MAWRSAGSLSRSLSRVSSLRSPPPMPRLRPPQAASRPQARRFSFANSRNFAELGCTISFLPLHGVVPAARLTSHLSINARAFSELSHGRNGKDG